MRMYFVILQLKEIVVLERLRLENWSLIFSILGGSRCVRDVGSAVYFFKGERTIDDLSARSGVMLRILRKVKNWILKKIHSLNMLFSCEGGNFPILSYHYWKNHGIPTGFNHLKTFFLLKNDIFICSRWFLWFKRGLPSIWNRIHMRYPVPEIFLHCKFTSPFKNIRNKKFAVSFIKKTWWES